MKRNVAIDPLLATCVFAVASLGGSGVLMMCAATKGNWPTTFVHSFSPSSPSRANSRDEAVFRRRPAAPTPIGCGTRSRRDESTTALFFEGRGDYYGESGSSFMVQEFGTFDQLQEVVDLASRAMPQRPDGIVTVAKFTSSSRQECKETEAGYERLARANPDTIFLRIFEEFEDAHLVFGQAKVTSLPTFDIFHGGNRVGRIEGTADYDEVERYVKSYGVLNSKLDLFSEVAGDSLRPWGDGKKGDYTKTPRTTARFIPGYDWNTKKGFFDATADKAMSSFEETYENWVPKVDEDENKRK